MSRIRPSWCKCRRNFVCEGHRKYDARLEAAFDEGEQPELATGDVIALAYTADDPGKDSGYDYSRGRWQRGSRPPTAA
jgi:hypothetical protein